MKSLKVLISLALTLAIILSVGTVYAATDLGGGYLGYKLNGGTLTSVNDGTLSVIQPAEDVYYYVDDNNMLINAGFEDSDTVVNSKNSSEMTTGWIDNQSNNSTKLSVSLSKSEVHSGANSLYMLLNTTDAGPRLYNNAQNSTDCYFIVDKDQKYTFSYWAKGNASIRVIYQTWDSSQSKWSSSTWPIKDVNYKAPGDDWQLITHEFSVDQGNAKLYSGADSEDESDDVYVARMAVHTCITKGGSAGEYAYLDDVQLQTTEQAIKNVVSMIENLDITLSTAERAIDDIKQWVAVLGSDNISNYADFEKKVEDYSKYAVYGYVNTNGVAPNNASFEASNEASVIHSRKDTYVKVTDSWMTNWTMNSTEKPFQNASISNDAHSGKNSLNIRITSNDNNAYNLVIHNADNYAGLIPYTSYGLPNQKYIVSLWVKGDSVRGRSTKYTEATDGSSNGAWAVGDWAPVSGSVGDAWKLYTFQITTNSLGQAGWYIYAQHTANTTIETYIDDIHVATKEQYIANVETMIDNLNTSAPYAARAIDDIVQWVNVLGSENISNYDLFLMKKSGYVYYSEASTLDNTGFEKSDSVNSFNGDGYNKELTTGWTTNYGGSKVIYAMSKDAHSGNNAISVEVKAGNNTRLFNTKNMVYTDSEENNVDLDYRTQGLKPNTEYIISYWVKGTGQTHVWGRTVDNEGKNSGEYRGEYIVDPGENWKLGTNKLTTSENGEFWFNIFTNNSVAEGVDTSTVENITAIIDDIQVLTVEENIAFVDSLIDQFAKLDKSNANYARAKADIEQWLPVLDSADLNLKYDIVLNEKYNIITPNEGYTHLAQGDYIASVTLKGKGKVNRVYGDNITNITSITTELTDEYVTHRERVTVGAYGTHYMGVQLTNSAAINTVDIKDFSLKRVGDVNESGEIDIRDMIRMAKGLNGTDTTVDALVADYDNSSSFDRDDIAAVRELVLNKDLLS